MPRQSKLITVSRVSYKPLGMGEIQGMHIVMEAKFRKLLAQGPVVFWNVPHYVCTNWRLALDGDVHAWSSFCRTLDMVAAMQIPPSPPPTDVSARIGEDPWFVLLQIARSIRSELGGLKFDPIDTKEQMVALAQICDSVFLWQCNDNDKACRALHVRRDLFDLLF